MIGDAKQRGGKETDHILCKIVARRVKTNAPWSTSGIMLSLNKNWNTLFAPSPEIGILRVH